MDLWDIFDTEWVPVGAWTEAALQWVVANFRFIFQAIKVPLRCTQTKRDLLPFLLKRR